MVSNKVDIKDVMAAVKENSPLPFVSTITWEHPGYIHVAFPADSNMDFYVALGKSLSDDTGYSWNDTDGKLCGVIEDLDSADDVALTFWGQVIRELNL